MIGKAIAGEAKATFFYISASSLTSKWVCIPLALFASHIRTFGVINFYKLLQICRCILVRQKDVKTWNLKKADLS